MAEKTDEPLSLKGNRDKLLDFTHKVKKNKEKVWDVLEPFLKDYIKKGKK